MPALVEGADFLFIVGKQRAAFDHGFGKRLAAIELEDPVPRADVAQERLHLRFIREHRAVEMTRVPVDQDLADIEHDDGGVLRWHGSSRKASGGRALAAFPPETPITLCSQA